MIPHFKTITNLTELGVNLNSFIGIFQCFRERHQFHVRCSSIVVSPCICRVTLDTFTVVLDGSRKVACFEFHISFLACNCTLLWVDIRLSIFLSFLPFNLAQFVKNFRGAMLSKRFLEVLDG